MTLTTAQGTANRAAKGQQPFALISSDPRLARAIHDLSKAGRRHYGLRAARAMADLYVVIYRIWNGAAATKPFALRGKEGQWKQVDQAYLADSLDWSAKTVARGLAALATVGLIRYEKHGYNAKKYVQLRSFEQAHADAVLASGRRAVGERQASGRQMHDKRRACVLLTQQGSNLVAPVPDSRQIVPQQGSNDLNTTNETICPFRKGQFVQVETDNLSESNIKRADPDSIYREGQDLRPQHSCVPPTPRDKKIQILKTAIHQYEQRQKQLDGIRTDHATLQSLADQSAGMSDQAIADACATALHLTHAWAWAKGYPSSCTAGQAISAALHGRVWSPLPGETCTPDVDEAFAWDPDAGTFLDSLGFDLFDRQVLEPMHASVMAPSALDKEKPTHTLNTLTFVPVARAYAPTIQIVPSAAPECLVKGGKRDLVSLCPVKAAEGPLEPAAEHTPAQMPQIVPETHKTQPESEQERMRRLLLNFAKQRDALSISSSSSSGRYGSPSSPTADSDCGEEYFSRFSRRPSSTTTLEDPDW